MKVPVSKRLQTAADFVPEGAKVADIGCDHAYTSIYMATEKNLNKIIAMDIKEGPLTIARENIAKFNCEIDVRLSDGTKALQPGEVDTLLISGMGGWLIVNILKVGYEGIKELILQPQSEVSSVRHFLHQSGYMIKEETMLMEDGKYYVIIHAVRGKEEYKKEYEYTYGKCLMQKKDEILYSFLNHEEAKIDEVKEALGSVGTVRAKERLAELLHIIDEIKRVKGDYYG